MNYLFLLRINKLKSTFVCYICDKSFQDKFRCRRHLADVHQAVGKGMNYRRNKSQQYADDASDKREQRRNEDMYGSD